MIPKRINGQWRVVHQPTAWNIQRGIAGKPCNATIYESEDDAWAYIDKFDDVRGMI